MSKPFRYYSYLVGQKFSRLEVKSFSHITKNRLVYWNCLCICGTFRPIRGTRLKSGYTVSCGCYQKEIGKTAGITHGMSKDPTHIIWRAIKHRCYNPKATVYKYYGERGIKLCDRWLKFENFLTDMGEKPEGLSIERKDNNLGYFKNNCKWATQKEQANNKRNNVWITVDGITHNVTQWERIKRHSVGLVSGRIFRGWSPEKAVMTPVK